MTWTGRWVTDRLGVRLQTVDAPVGVALHDLVGLAVRRSERRAHLLVSRALGKHVPTDPRLVYGCGLLLGLRVGELLGPASGAAPSAQAGPALGAALRGQTGAAALLLTQVQALVAAGPQGGARGCVVLGFAETATALGHSVADALSAPCLHSTRRPVAGVSAHAGFEEAHSHATSHLLLPADPALLTGTGPLVLVDDELSTGRTMLNTIAELHSRSPRSRYVVAVLVDLRSDDDRSRMAATAAELGARVDVVALATGRIDLPDDVLAAGRDLVAQLGAPSALGPAPTSATAEARRVGAWPAGVSDGGRHGFTTGDAQALTAAAAGIAEDVLPGLVGARVLVLGFEELMYAPLRIAVSLADLLDRAERPDAEVRFSTTTRSPVLAVDDPGYPIRTMLEFAAHDDPADGPGQRYAYNVAAGLDPARRSTDIVLVIDDLADTPAAHAAGGLVAQLREHCDQVHLVVVPSRRPATAAPLRGPAFGSYAPDEVAWLLTDLSQVQLEAPTEEREEAIAAGGAHYAESLPIEYQPSADYQALFEEALVGSAARVAHAVGIVTEMVLAARGERAVLVSLARAGTPIGILMRRWASVAHGLDLAHYAISIVRARGIDQVALRYLLAHHPPSDVMFVDGWTGKGAIARELTAAVAHANADLGLPPGAGFAPDLAVLADPGSCVEIFGTRDDFLIASAALNSTVSGLVSRTVLNPALLGPGDFHGAKFYAHLREADVSRRFLDQVSAHFPQVAEAVARDWPLLAASDRTPTWRGWAAVEAISAAYGVGDVNLVKPGVGETTRVLLRRVPWKILVRPDAVAELAHVRLLAQQRGVDIVEVDDLPYSCVGIIRPQFRQGAA